MANFDNDELSTLAKDAQSGNTEALNKFLTEVCQVVEPIVKRKLFNCNQHEDCIQEILIAVHSALHTFDRNRSIRPWLSAITNHKIIDMIRSQVRHDQRELYKPEVIERAVSPDRTLPSSKLGDLALDALNSLPESYRQAVSLLKIDGLSVIEASEKLGISQSALKVRASRGYKMIQKKIGGVIDEY